MLYCYIITVTLSTYAGSGDNQSSGCYIIITRRDRKRQSILTKPPQTIALWRECLPLNDICEVGFGLKSKKHRKKVLKKYSEEKVLYVGIVIYQTTTDYDCAFLSMIVFAFEF